MLLEIAHPSQVSVARRAAEKTATSRGFDSSRTGRAALIVTELATNIIKHAKSGEIIISGFADACGTGIEMIALDKATGIENLPAALADGTSTAGSPGFGLGVVRRQADHFYIFSTPKMGTVVAARVMDGYSQPCGGGTAIGSVVAPYPGEEVCGDAWTYGASNKGETLFLVDGSGHGEQAYKAATEAVRIFQDHLNADCGAIIDAVHRGLGHTRGAAVAIARVDRRAGVVRFVGVGNVVGAVVSPDGQTRRMVSHNGTAGFIAPRIREFEYPFSQGSEVLLHSDGLSAKWDFASYPGLAAAHPSIAASVLFRDFRRSSDDASVVTMRA